MRIVTDPDACPQALPPSAREPWPSFLRTMTYIGMHSFGGPVAQIGLLREQAVERRKWLSNEQFMHVLDFAQVLPGPEALEVAIHLGWLRRGMAGGLAAGLLFLWPGFVSLTVLAALYTRFGELGPARGVLGGVRAVAAALIVWAAVRMADRVLRGPLAWGLMAAALTASAWLQWTFVPILLGAGSLGILSQRWQSTPTTKREPRLRLPLIAGLLLLAMAVATPLTGPKSGQESAPRVEAPLDELALVELKAALITFGGAYAVLPYLHEQMTQAHPWLTDREVIDGLALGETTPGPLVSVGVFFAYLAAGLPGALVGGLCLFAPSFVLVLTLAPHLTRIAQWPGMAGFLRGVSAATVGLMLALAARVVPASLPDVFGIAVCALAGLALAFGRVPVPLLVVLGGLAGALRSVFA